MLGNFPKHLYVLLTNKQEVGGFISELVLYRKFLPHGVLNSPFFYSANEPHDFTKLFVLFFCTFTDKILNSYVPEDKQ
jgi:hypothetical protein